LGRGLLANFRRGAVIAVLGVVGVVYLAMEVGRTMKPRTGADEDAASEPLRPIVAVGNTGIRSVVIVAIGAIRGHSHFDHNLSICFELGCRKRGSSDCC
jgi:hypothetical protein